MYHPNTGIDGLARLTEVNPLPFIVDFAAIFGFEGVKHLHQGAFAGAIFPHNSVDLTFAKGQRDIIHCNNVGWKNFNNILELDDIVHNAVLLNITITANGFVDASNLSLCSRKSNSLTAPTVDFAA